MDIKAYIGRENKSLRAFSRDCGLSHVYVWQIANGKRRASMGATIRIHRASGGEVSFRDLAGEELEVA